MKKILIDQNFDGPILRGLVARIPELDVVRVEDIGLKQSTDPNLLAWAAEEDRLILTHDAKTFPAFALERMSQGKRFSGIIVVPRNMSIRRAIEELMIVLLCSTDDELIDIVKRLPI